jgi:hypothetical protein
MEMLGFVGFVVIVRGGVMSVINCYGSAARRATPRVIG